MVLMARLAGHFGRASIPGGGKRVQMATQLRKLTIVTFLMTLLVVMTSATTAFASLSTSYAPIIGSGSSFAGPEVLDWQTNTSLSPYNLNVNFTPTNSSDGRFSFANQTIDFGVTDIRYQPFPYDTKSPQFPFMYVPVTAGGLAFMYHINGLDGTLQLSSYSACSIFTGYAKYWDDPVIKADNPHLNLPHIRIFPVTRSDLAGTNYVFEEYCIDEQPALWAAFIASVEHVVGQNGDLSATEPRSDWPLFPGSIPVNGSATAADTVAGATSNGYITAVETAYALQRHFPVASVKNASGDYTQPTPVDVASALAYATQLPDGTHVLDFNGLGPHVYNPSTYSYLLTPTTGWNAAKGATLSAFVNYALTVGQQKATEIGYASLGLSLEQYGARQVQNNVPGAVPLTAVEQAAYATGDFTVAEVQAGDTTPGGGVATTTTTTTIPKKIVTTTTTTVPKKSTTTTTVPKTTTTTTIPKSTTTTTVPKKNVTTTTVPKKNVTTTTVPKKNVTTTTVPRRNVTTTTVPKRSTTPTTVPKRNVTTTTIPKRSTTPTTVPKRSTTTTTIPKKIVTTTTIPKRIVTTTVPKRSTTATTVPKRSTTATTVPNGATTTTVPNSATTTTVPNNATTTTVANSATTTTVANSGDSSAAVTLPGESSSLPTTGGYQTGIALGGGILIIAGELVRRRLRRRRKR